MNLIRSSSHKISYKSVHGLWSIYNLGSRIVTAAVELFDQIANRSLTVRRITIAANRVVQDEGVYQFDLFSDVEKQEKEKTLQKALLGIKKKYGKNAILKGTNFLVYITREQISVHG